MRSSGVGWRSTASTCLKPGQGVAAGSDVRVDDPARRYVSRAALKLVAGLDRFGFDPAGSTALDIGASTGGFTEVLLERGAARRVRHRRRPWADGRASPLRPPRHLDRGPQRPRPHRGPSRRRTAGFPHLRRELHFAEAGAAAGPRPCRGRAPGPSCSSSRSSRPAARQSARAGCSNARTKARRPRAASRHGWTVFPAGAGSA